jgi:thymidylate synthase (FAD)
MVEFKFHAKLPIFIARQWIRHRMSSTNEYSGRYSVMKDEFYFPEIENIRQQSKVNKQGGEEKIDIGSAERFLEVLTNTCEDAYSMYQTYIDKGVAREQSRMILPVNNYTEWYWKIDLHNLFHFLGLRCDAHAQWEIRVFAEAMLKLITPIVPVAVEAWNDYHDHRGAVKLTRLEIESIRKALQETDQAMVGSDVNAPALDSDNKREQAEWVDKAKKLGFIVRE